MRLKIIVYKTSAIVFVVSEWTLKGKAVVLTKFPFQVEPKLSKWLLSAEQATKISSKWQHFRFEWMNQYKYHAKAPCPRCALYPVI